MEYRDFVKAEIKTTIDLYYSQIESALVGGRARPIGFEDQMSEFLYNPLALKFRKSIGGFYVDTPKFQRRIGAINTLISREMCGILILKRIAIHIGLELLSPIDDQFLLIALTREWCRKVSQIKRLEKRVLRENGRRVFNQIVERVIEKKPEIENYLLAIDLTTPSWIKNIQIEIFNKVIAKPVEEETRPGKELVYFLRAKKHKISIRTLENIISATKTQIAKNNYTIWDTLGDKW